MSLKLAKLPLLQYLPITPSVLGTIALFVALIPISSAPILVRLCGEEIGSIAIVFHRAWIAAIVFGLWSGFQASQRQQSADCQSIDQQPLTTPEIRLLFLTGTVSVTYQLMWAWSLTQTDIANVALLSNLNPLFVGLAGYLLFGQQFDRQFVIGLVIALGGAIAFELNKIQFATDQIQGDALALLTAIFIAIHLLLVERLQARFNTVTIMLWRCGVTTIILLPLLPLIEHRLFPHSPMGWFLIIFQALFCQVLGQGLLAYSLGKLSSGVVAITLLLEPILASIFAWFIFSEQITLFDWIAFAIVIGGIYLAKSSKFAVKPLSEKVPNQTSK